MLEAYASGLPAVCVRAGGSQDLVEAGRTGLLAEPNDPFHLADTIDRVLRFPGLGRHLARGALAAAERYTWPAVNGRLLDAYERVVARRARGPAPRVTQSLVSP